MPVKYNGTRCDYIIYNGTSISSVKYNGTEVYPEAGYVTLSATSGSGGTANSFTFTVKTNHGGSLSVVSSNTNAIKCSISGTTVTCTRVGTAAVSATITVTCAAAKGYKAASATYSASFSASTQTFKITSVGSNKTTYNTGTFYLPGRSTFRSIFNSVTYKGDSSVQTLYSGSSNGTANYATSIVYAHTTNASIAMKYNRSSFLYFYFKNSPNSCSNLFTDYARTNLVSPDAVLSGQFYANF